ncbi:MAG: CocE/NonD family hydrolase [Paludibaculum sp.]
MRWILPLLWLAGCAAEPLLTLHVKIPMRDGIRLCTNIFRPAPTGRFPVVIQRTPYRKVSELTPGLQAFLRRGYAVITQDVRGRYDSDGEFNQYNQEMNDGDDTISWVARQSWSDGRVGMFGGSYVGLSQWRTALSGNPALKAITPALAGGDEYTDRYYSRGGAFKLGHRLRWIAENYKPAETPVVDFQRMVTYLPLRRADRLVSGRMLEFFQTVLNHPSYDEYWRRLSTVEHIEQIHVPAFIEAGWYDNYAQSDLEMWSGLRALGRPARIIVGPWGHNLSPVMPEAQFGDIANQPLRRMEIEWFDAYVKQSAPAPASAVRYFLMGANEWKESESWPPKPNLLTAFYLTSKKGANSLNGDGKLILKQQKKGASDFYTYDPKVAVPTVGGALCCNNKIFPWGPFDQRRVEGRRDVLVYTSDPLKKAIEVTGPIKVILHVVSSAEDTDFTAKLVDVGPDGRAVILCDGILRLRYRQGIEKAVKYVPGAVERIEIDAGVTSNLFKAGHRIRVDISSSNFPKYDRNLNTGGPLADEKTMRTARQEIRHGQEWDSHVLLPVVQ